MATPPGPALLLLLHHRGLDRLLCHSSLDTVMIYTEPNLNDQSARMERGETADVLSGE